MEILGIILLVLVIVLYFLYVTLIKRRNKALEALSGIDVHYNMRFDLIPNILKVAQKFMDHEKGLLEEITALRTEAQKGYDKGNKTEVAEHFGAIEALAGKMNGLMVAVENYPDLKSDQTMMQAMRTYNEVEAQIAAARRFYNSSVTELNNAVQIFPGNLVAPIAGVQEMPFLEVVEEVRAPVDAADYLK